MEIEKAQELGLCFGVRRAIKLLKEAANKYGEIETLGPLAHNQQLVEGLTNIGVRPVNRLEQVQGKILAIPAHGTSPTILSEIQACHFHIIDVTCPIVRKAQNAAKELTETGFNVIIFGEAAHSEVKGLLGWTGGTGMAALDVGRIDMPRLLRSARNDNGCRLGVISQTTQSQSAFIEFTRELISTFLSKAKEIHIVNTLCQAVQTRREAATRLAQRSQLMIVVGGHNSANSKLLAEACSLIVETHMVGRAKEIDSSWFVDKQRIGIAAGTSTPDEAIEEVIINLKSLSTSHPESS